MNMKTFPDTAFGFENISEEVETVVSSGRNVVLMCGISGSGKTVFSKALESRGYSRIAADEILWEKYGDEFPTLPADVQKQAFMSMGSLLREALIPHLEAKRKVVVDSTMCKHTKREEISRLCESFGISPLTVFLKASPEVLAKRLAGRKGIGPNDQIIPPEKLQMYCSGFESPDGDADTLVFIQS